MNNDNSTSERDEIFFCYERQISNSCVCQCDKSQHCDHVACVCHRKKREKKERTNERTEINTQHTKNTHTNTVYTETERDQNEKNEKSARREHKQHFYGVCMLFKVHIGSVLSCLRVVSKDELCMQLIEYVHLYNKQRKSKLRLFALPCHLCRAAIKSSGWQLYLLLVCSIESSLVRSMGECVSVCSRYSSIPLNSKAPI